jgi:outer membrane protein
VVLLTGRALDGRLDLRAARASARAAAAAQSGAEHNLLPKLDLAFSLGYGGGLARDGVGPFFAALGRNLEGLNAGARLSLELPVENSAQLGERVRASAQRMAAENALFDLSRTMRNQVVSAYDELRYAVAALREAVQAEQLYDQALADERYKLRAGLSTVIDVVLTEDLLTQATRARIVTQLDVGVALARLRLELGLLPSEPQGAAHALAGVLDAGVFDGS